MLLLLRVYSRTNTIWKSILSAKNKVKAYNLVCVELFSYCFGIIKWTKSALENLDKDVRKIMTMNKGFNKHSDVDRLILQRKNGGRGLVCIKDFYDRMCVSTVGYMMKATTAQGKTIKEQATSAFYSIKLCNKLYTYVGMAQREDCIDALIIY